jgi:hypothetical protein
MMIFNGQTATREGQFSKSRFNLLDFWSGNNISDDILHAFLGNFEILNK